MLLKFFTYDFDYIKIRNNTMVKIMDIGKFCVKTNIRCKIVLNNIRYVLKMNL